MGDTHGPLVSPRLRLQRLQAHVHLWATRRPGPGRRCRVGTGWVSPGDSAKSEHFLRSDALEAVRTHWPLTCVGSGRVRPPSLSLLQLLPQPLDSGSSRMDVRQAPDKAAAVAGSTRLSVSVSAPVSWRRLLPGGCLSWGLPVSLGAWAVGWGRRQAGASADTDCLSSGGSPSRFRRWSRSRACSRLLPGGKVGPGCCAALGLVI